MFQRDPSRALSRLLLGAVFGSSLLITGCAARGGNIAYDQPNFGPPDMESLPLGPTAQHIAPLDTISVTVFQVQDLSGDFTVDGAGEILYPLLGSVVAAGKTPPQLAREIAAGLQGRYLQAPNVQVAMKEITEQVITVEGAVRQPGVVAIKGSTSLLQAIALGRGMTEDANPARVVVFRTIEGQRMAAAFDVRSIRRAEAPDPVIYGNDIVVVDGVRGRALFRDILTTIPILGLFTAL